MKASALSSKDKGSSVWDVEGCLTLDRPRRPIMGRGNEVKRSAVELRSLGVVLSSRTHN